MRNSYTSFYQLTKREQIAAFLDTKIKSQIDDPEKRWITTWNHYLRRIKLFLRWLHNGRSHSSNSNSGISSGNNLFDGVDNNDDDDDYSSPLDWKTPAFAAIKEKRTKRLSPYSETEIWDREELLSILKYAGNKRNKAALALFWDLDARNHEVTMLKIKTVHCIKPILITV